MSTIETKSKKVDREITIPSPTVLSTDSVAALVETLGEELVVAKVQAQLTIDFRSMVRNLIEAQDDNGDFKNSDEEITAMDFTDWKPSLRVRKSPEEKAKDALTGLSPEQIKEVLAMLDNA